MNVDTLQAALISATDAAANAALRPLSASMRQDVANRLAQALATLEALPGDEDNVVPI